MVWILCWSWFFRGSRIGDPNGIRTRVTAVKGRCPRPLDDRVVPGERNMAGRRRCATEKCPTANRRVLGPESRPVVTHTPRGEDCGCTSPDRSAVLSDRFRSARDEGGGG